MDLFGASDYSEYNTDDQRSVLYEQIGFGSPGLDPYLHQLFYDYYYNDNLSMRQRLDTWDRLQEYVESEYNILFDMTWDWEAFREWYDSL